MPPYQDALHVPKTALWVILQSYEPCWTSSRPRLPPLLQRARAAHGAQCERARDRKRRGAQGVVSHLKP
eukprot:2335227-Pleurochrysis_carterae.AAC.1